MLSPVTLFRSSTTPFNSVGISRESGSYIASKTRLPSHSSRVFGFRERISSCSLNYGPKSLFKDLRPSVLGLSRVSAVSGGGSGGAGGSGGSGDGNSGGGSDDGDGAKNWSLLSWYLALLSDYPVLTKAVTSAILNLIGDLICQIAIDRVPSIDTKRMFMFTFLGLVLVGPTLHFWYLYLSKLVTASGTSGAILRLIIDQFMFSPIFIGVFLSSLVTLEGKPSQAIPRLQQEWVGAVLANWQLWIPFQFLNFRFVPQHLQVLAANVVALAWNVILSFKAHREVLAK